MSRLQWNLAFFALSLAGCDPTGKQGPGDDGDPTPNDGSGESSSSTGDGATSTDPSTDPSASTTPTSAEDSSSDTTCSFICETGDETGPPPDCDLWAQDCPDGEKCMPWANDGGNAWNSARCSPIDDDAGEVGDECTVEGSGISGVDDCARDSMCWNVDEDNHGVCISFCGGTEANPTCDDPSTNCVIANDGFLILCLPSCDPLLQDCNSDTEACYPVDDGFACAPDASGTAGVFGDACAFINACDAGFFCANAEAVPGCGGQEGCCSNFCDLSLEDPNAACTAAGQECTAWYEDGQTPPGGEDIGACAIPQ